MATVLEEHVLPVTCLKCGAKIEKTVAWLRTHDRLDCPCGTSIPLQTDALMAAVAAVDAELKTI